MSLLTKQDVTALLGRPLTTVEDTNFDLYIQIAGGKVSGMLCQSLESESAVREFTRRKEFSTVYTGLFTDINSVKVDGVETTDYTPYFWDSRNSEVFNSIVFNKLPSGTDIEIDAEWGFDCFPKDLQLLLAQAFASTATAYSTKEVKSKQVEDFRITYGEQTADELLVAANASTIFKYSLCNIPDLQNGCSL